MSGRRQSLPKRPRANAGTALACRQNIRNGRPAAPVTACSFEFIPPFVRPPFGTLPRNALPGSGSGARAPFSQPWAGGRAVGLQVRCIDHQRISSAARTGQFEKHPGEDTLLAPTLPATAEGLVWPVFCGRVFCRRVPPPQAIAVDEGNPAQDTLVIDTPACRGMSERMAPALPSATRSASKDHSYHHSVFAAVNHAARRKSMHPDRKKVLSICFDVLPDINLKLAKLTFIDQIIAEQRT